MRHTSIRLSERHLELIKSTGKGHSEVMRAALDLYFQIKPVENDLDKMRALIREHEERRHAPRHKMSTSPDDVPPNVLTDEAQRAHIGGTFEAHVPQNVRGGEARKRRSPKPPILEDDERKRLLIEMVRSGEQTLAQMGERLGGYDKAAVSRAISKLKEEGELEGEESTGE